MWVQNELTFDSYEPGNIYRITGISHYNNENNKFERSAVPMAAAVEAAVPEIQHAVALQPNNWGGFVFNVDNKLFDEKTSAWVDKNWFTVFKYTFVQGSPVAFKQNPYSLVLTESKAKKFFGEAPAAGQVIKIDTVNYTVAGVVKDNLLNSSFQFDIFLQMDAKLRGRARRYANDWNNLNFIDFAQVAPGASIPAVEAKMTAVVAKSSGSNDMTISLVPLKSLYFEDGISSSLPHGNKTTTYIFGLLGLLLLVIACINYVNLTTARASVRAKEISVRKIVGAGKVHLIAQFIAESLIISAAAIVVTLSIMQILLPVFDALTGKNFQLPLTSVTMWQILGGTLLLATVLNGVYPALLLSSFKPLNVLRGKTILKMGTGSIRKALVIFQFSLSVVLIVATIVIYRQIRFIQSTNPGYNISQVVSLTIPYENYSKLPGDAVPAYFETIKQQLQQQPGVTGVTTGSEEIVDIGNSSGGADWLGRDTAYKPQINRLSVDPDFQKVMGLQLKSGRWFRPGKQDYSNFIINETAEKEFNMHKPVIGQQLFYRGDTGIVIGVVKDFHYKSMHEKIGPMILYNNQGSDNYFFVKLSNGKIPTALSRIAGVWKNFVPKKPFSYNFLDDSFNNLYKSDVKTSQLLFIFSFVAIVICALGLFGLATFTAERRTKEIGIRKILGASVSQVTVLLTKEFLVLVVVAVIIASPLAWWAMHTWLQGFAYRVSLGYGIFIIAGIIALVIAAVSVGTQAIKTAMSNPANSLRTE